MAAYYRQTQWEHLNKFFLFAFIIIGIFFLVLAIVKYHSYRNNPQAVSLSKVMIYLFLVILIISVPFLRF